MQLSPKKWLLQTRITSFDSLYGQWPKTLYLPMFEKYVYVQFVPKTPQYKNTTNPCQNWQILIWKNALQDIQPTQWGRYCHRNMLVHIGGISSHNENTIWHIPVNSSGCGNAAAHIAASIDHHATRERVSLQLSITTSKRKFTILSLYSQNIS